MIDDMISVAVYCRVSTEKQDQLNSFEGQIRFFREYIAKDSRWSLYEVYADEGITGTNVKKREAFKRMIDDARLGRFRLILTKEISRFARNILDSISYTRELKRMGVGVIFLNDNIDTRDGDAELRLAILSSIAQEESRRTSERVKWGQKRRMEAGVVFGHSLLGYDVREGKLLINENGAETVRWIFDQYTRGLGISAIVRALEEQGVKPKKAEKWSSSVILRMLKNEKYCGDLVQKKTFTPDYLSHEKKYNHGEEELVAIKDHHEAIVSRAQFERVQTLLSARRSEKVAGKYSKAYAFSGKVRCGICGRAMVARVQTRKSGTYHLWRCTGRHPSNSVRNHVVAEMLRLVIGYYENELTDVKRDAIKALERVLFEESDGEKNENMRRRLMELYLLGEITKEDYLLTKHRFLEKKKRLDSLSCKIDDLFFDEAFFREMLETAVIYESFARVRLQKSKKIFIFDTVHHGRSTEVKLCEIQEGEGNDSLLFSSGIDINPDL